MNKIKMSVFSFITVSILITVIIFPKEILESSKNGLILWYKNVIPSLFVFMTGVSILSLTGFSKTFGKLFKNIMTPLFSVSKECAFPWIMGLISGSPTSAKIIADLYKEGIISRKDAQRTLSFSSNASPLFITGTVATSMLGFYMAGYFIMFIVIISSISTGFVFKFIDIKETNKKTSILKNRENKYYTVGEILKKSIYSSSETIIMIGGFIVLFSVIICTLEIWGIFSNISNLIYNITGISNEYSKGIISGIMEMTCGCNILSQCNIDLFSKIVGIVLVISFSGISINLQTISVFSNTDLSPFIYIISKILNTVFALIYTVLFYGLLEKHIQKTVPTVFIQGTDNISILCIVFSYLVVIMSFINCIYFKIKK